MPLSELSCPRILVAGLGGGSGKTIVSLGLARAFTERGLHVQTFKKGPDYIDAKWLSLASSSTTSNLDPFLLSSDVLKNVFWSKAHGCDLALIEGNRGLYDGKDVDGSCSSAELAKMLKTPVLIVADCTKVTRTMAAILLGLRTFDPEVDIRGVILNRTAGCRHQTILRQSIEKYTDVPVLGVLPKMGDNPIPERHMGLISNAELNKDPFSEIAAFLRDHVDLSACLRIAKTAPPYHDSLQPLFPVASAQSTVRIGVVKDAALWFYYQENLEALQHAGAEIIEFSLITDPALPSDIDALYMGGGFPETLADKLASNQGMRLDVAAKVAQGLPVYAECGGFMYLGSSLLYNDQSYPMAGVFPLSTKVFQKPQGHGYMQSVVKLPNPFYPVRSSLNGHEFHYSRCVNVEQIPSFVFQVERGQGMTKGWDGVLTRNCLAAYTHMHALSTPNWANNFIRAARTFRDYRLSNTSCPDIRI